MRELVFAAVLAVAAVLIVVGISLVSDAGAWCFAGVALAGGGWLVLGGEA